MSRDRVDQNLSTILERAAARFGDREAVRFGRHAVSFRQLDEASRRVAGGLAALGIGRGDRVAVLLRNGLEWVETFFALSTQGVVCVPVNVFLRAAEVEQVCRDAEVSAIVVDQAGRAVLDGLDSIPPTVIVSGDAEPDSRAERVVPYASLQRASAVAGTVPGLDDDLVLYYSSGTTGLPKAAIHTHATVLWNSFHQVSDLALSETDTNLVVPSLSWAAGFHDVMLALLWIGGRSVILPTGGVTIDRICREARANKVTCALLVPTLLKQLVDAPSLRDEFRAAGLRFVLTGAEPVPLPLIQAFGEAFPETRLLQGYGLSEFPTIATMLREEEAAERAGWAGRSTSITHLAVLAGDGSIRSEGDGEILLRSPATMRGYWNRPRETAEAFARGWLHTGDLGFVDGEGFLRITGRKKDMIISGGLNVYPSEVEAVVYDFPGVKEAAVVGVADERWGEVPVAIVVPSEPLEPEGLISFCRERLASYKTPKEVFLRDAPLPRTTSGKVLKRELRPWAERQRRGTR